MKKRYLVVHGITYRPHGDRQAPQVSVEPGGPAVEDLPEASIGWLLEQGHIQEAAAFAEGDVFRLEGDVDVTLHTGETAEIKPRGGRTPAKE